jgi:succinoglycan biosynthesis transport protein ExoP
MDQVTTSTVPLPITSALDRPIAIGRRSFRRRAATEAEESYRKAALFLSKSVANGTRSFLFCSARRGEGTTTAVLSLAHQLQDNYGLRPLVIELTRYKPRLAKLFALTSPYTLDDALMQTHAVADCVQLTASGLSVITGDSGHSAQEHPGLLSNLGRVLKEVEGAFDVVLVDAPPVLAQADAIVAATTIQTVILVVESGRTSYEVLDRVKGEFANQNISIAGTVLVRCKHFIPRWMSWWSER